MRKNYTLFKRYALAFALFAITAIVVYSCKKETDQTFISETLDSKIERDSLFIEWAKTGSGRWINYSFQKIDKHSINKDNVYSVLNSSVKYVYNARKYYENLLYSKYGDMDNFSTHLDSLYKKNYDKISYDLRMRKSMDELYSKYLRIPLSKPLSRNRLSMSTSPNVSYFDNGILDDVVIYGCGIPEDLVNFYNIYLRFRIINFVPPGSTSGAVNCRIDALNRISSSFNSLKYAYNSGYDCALHRDEAYTAMREYFDCDPLESYPGWSPFDPFAGGGGGGGAPSGDNNEDAQRQTDCETFLFKKTTSANWQEAGINNIKFKMVWVNFNGAPDREIEFPIDHVVIGFPTYYTNVFTGETFALSPGKAANRAALAVEFARDKTYAQFANQPFAMETVIKNFFITTLNASVAANQGTAGFNGSGSPNIVFNSEKRSYITDPLDCDD